ncbi:hypothetical protein pipiens_012220 [Culex pipiens pipiens]|uniref:Uncharacterized protein n=1 Tax=Culex pipiens pipiens TaxID=38569 RepID=A0ABD1D3P3_CULPP
MQLTTARPRKSVFRTQPRNYNQAGEKEEKCRGKVAILLLLVLGPPPSKVLMRIGVPVTVWVTVRAAIRENLGWDRCGWSKEGGGVEVPGLIWNFVVETGVVCLIWKLWKGCPRMEVEVVKAKLLGKRRQQPQPTQHKINYSHNLQYLEIVSLSDGTSTNNGTAVATARRLVPEVQSHLNLAEEVANHERRQRRDEFFAQLRKQVSRDRRKTIHRMATSPVYVNGNFERPWQTVSRVSDQLIEELIADTAQDGALDFGERSFVEDFLRLQLGG